MFYDPYENKLYEDDEPLFCCDPLSGDFYISWYGEKYWLKEEDGYRIAQSNSDSEKFALMYKIIAEWLSGRYEI